MSGSPSRRALLAGGAAFAALPSAARAQGGAWPGQPIRLVVPFAPGGTTDPVARLLAQGLQDRLGQPLIIENRPGAGGTVGSLQVAQAAPDGHTLLVSNTASHGIAPTLYRDLRYDAVAGFTHIALVVRNPVVFVANTRFAPRTVGDIATFREQGVDPVSESWFGLSGPAGLPAPVVRRLAEATQAVLADPATAARFAELGGTPGRLSPEGYTDFIRAEVARWAPVVWASGAEIG